MAMAAALVGGSASEAAESCAVRVDFGSFCCGIDREAYQAAKDFAESSPLVAGQSERPYGMEGETVLCLQARSAADAKAIHAELSQRLGGRKRKAPVKVSMGAPK